MKRCGFCNRFFRLVIRYLVVQYFILKPFAAMLYEPVLATGRSISPGVGADILIPPFWLGVGLLRRRDVYSCEVLASIV
jgi:hypothetical protein